MTLIIHGWSVTTTHRTVPESHSLCSTGNLGRGDDGRQRSTNIQMFGLAMDGMMDHRDFHWGKVGVRGCGTNGNGRYGESTVGISILTGADIHEIDGVGSG
jgi:hypothetical protein